MIDEFDQVLVSPEASLFDTVRVIDRGGMQIALVVDGQGRLMGSVTDGDVRRGILRGVAMDASVVNVMNPNPVALDIADSSETPQAVMRREGVHQLPRVDASGRVVGLDWLDEAVTDASDQPWVVIMAGGPGTRLRPITQTLPKPMVPIGGRPLLESIMRSFADQGFNQFLLTVNYLADVVRDHFQDGKWLGVDIDYLAEETRLGTAGALSLLPHRPRQPIIVMNGDLLTSISLANLLAFHRHQGAKATMAVREHQMQVPFGVARTDGTRLTGIVEKPVESYFVNAGIYVLDPDVVDHIPANTFYDMPELFQHLLTRGDHAAVFPIREYWLDVGRIDDLERARADYEQVFG